MFNEAYLYGQLNLSAEPEFEFACSDWAPSFEECFAFDLDNKGTSVVANFIAYIVLGCISGLMALYHMIMLLVRNRHRSVCTRFSKQLPVTWYYGGARLVLLL